MQRKKCREVWCVIPIPCGYSSEISSSICSSVVAQELAFKRGRLVFVFNFSPVKSFDDYGLLAPAGEYDGVVDTDNSRYGGYGNIDEAVKHFTQPDPLYDSAGLGWLKLYLPARSAQVLRMASPKRRQSPHKRRK